MTAPFVERVRALPPWALVLVVYALTRLYAVVLLERTSRLQAANPWTGRDPGYLGMTVLWDGGWYERIAATGYPDTLPTAPGGEVQQNPWAFYPLLPGLARGLQEVTGASFPVAASTVALLAGAAAVVLMRSLLEPLVGRSAALWTVVLFCCHPAAPVLQLAYTESLATLLLVAVLLCLQRRRYLTAVPLVLLLGLTRPIAAPLAVVVAVHLVLRVARRGADGPAPRPAGPGGPLRGGVLLLAAGAAAVLWPLVAFVGTGRPSAYAQTMSAWRGGQQVEPVEPWLRTTGLLLGDLFGPFVLGVVVVALVAWVLAPSSRVLGADLRAWCLAYIGYLLLVLDPSTSLVRYLLLLFPLGALLVVASSSAAYRRAIAVALLAGQLVWVFWLWRFVPPRDLPP